MRSGKLTLRSLRPEDEASFNNAIAEFKGEALPFHFVFDYDESVPFTEWIERLTIWPSGQGLPDVPNTFLVGIVDAHIVGRVSIRHHLDNFLKKVGGHIGFGVVPSCRRQGYAKEMLRQSLPICSSLGIDRVLLTTDIDDVGSQRVIEECGGIFESVTENPETNRLERRYWIDPE